MKFTQRLGYYLGGFSMGLIILVFFLNGKDASCDYGPNARTVKNIASKPLIYSKKANRFIIGNKLDSTTIKNLIVYGDVDFSKSDTKADSCKMYFIESNYKKKVCILKVKNCKKKGILTTIYYKKETDD